MTSLDVRDMLDLPGAVAPRPAKKQKVAAPKVSGMRREVLGLGGDNPIAIVPEVSLFKKKRFTSRKPAAHWDLKPFRNSARNDDLVLRHWRRKPDIVAAPAESIDGEDIERKGEEMDDSTFAKFNVQVSLPKYNDEQYETSLKSDDWDKAETDYLMELCQDYDLRWPLIWDRYEWLPHMPRQPGEGEVWVAAPEPQPRSVEDLKARYYSVAAKMMAIQRPVHNMSQAEYSLHQLMTNFNPGQETNRKRFAETTMARSPEDRKEEENLLFELKRIMARSDKLQEEKLELYARLDAPSSNGTTHPFNSSQGLQLLLQQLMSSNKMKQRKSLVGPEGASPVPGSSNPQNIGGDRRESGHGHRESTSAGPSNKKGPGPLERRKLSEEEERTYGISHHERLTSGPIFRHDKTQRLITTKTATQQVKITNLLSALELPEKRLIMPTASVVKQFEELLSSIFVYLDAKKVVDKLDDSIKVEMAKKAEREKRERKDRGEPEPEGSGKAGEKDAEMPDADADPDMEGSEEHKVKHETREKSASAAPSARAASVHKRSASVLSQVSDKSTKRQKK